jgi:hypothetical protein
MKTTEAGHRQLSIEFVGMLLLLLAVLALLFHGIWQPGNTLFSNDGPLGRLNSASHHFPEMFTGCWSDLNGIGFNVGAAPPGISVGLQYLLKPLWFSKIYALISLLILGTGAWCFFSQMRLAPMACRLGGLAAALNSCFFSVACWGVGAQDIAAGLSFFALAALADTTAPRRWWRVMLAGFAVGWGVVDGADVGAIFSLFVAAFVFYQAWIAGGPAPQRLVKASTRLAVMVLCAGFIAAQAISTLVGTSIKGVVVNGMAIAGEDQPVPTNNERWDWATQWSLPVRETASLLVPGLFGYRMETPDGGAYWGEIGQDPAVTRYLENGRQGPLPHGFMRSSGGGFYTGVLVVLVAFWTVAQSFRRQDSIFNQPQRQWIWFWLGLALVSLLLTYGRFAPFYQVVYALPYFSTIRNPIKFIYLVSLAFVVLFAYGLDGLYRKYMPVAAGSATSGWPGIKMIWAKLGKRERAWLWGCVVALGLALAAWVEYASAYQSLVDYLHSVQFDTSAEAIAGFSIRQVGWFILFFILSSALLAAIFGGAFAGRKARWGSIFIALLLFIDLGRANLPWIVYWDYKDKYASNPIIDRLRDRPYEHRVTFLPGEMPANLPDLNRIYNVEWLQQQFPFYNIQTLDIVDMPRKPADFAAYVAANGSTPLSFVQMWQLTNTRYLVGLVDSLSYWNQVIGQTNQQIRILERFDVVPKPGPTNTGGLDYWTAVPSDNGPFALFDYTGALPRAMLFSNWQVQTNDQAELAQLFRPDFDPHECVLVSGGLPADAAPPMPRQVAGSVEFTNYSPRDIVLQSHAPAASVLLLNDH